MATITLLGSATFNTNSGTKTVTATPAVDDLIIIITAHTGNTSTTAPTDDNRSGTYTVVNTALKNASADTMKMWVRDAPIDLAQSTVFTHAPGATTGGGLAVFKITGMSKFGTSAIRQSAVQSNQAGGGTPTPVLGSAALTANALLGAVFNATNPATMTPRASPAWTERNDSGYAAPTTGLETMSINSGETATSIAWGGTSGSAFGSIVAELDTTFVPPFGNAGATSFETTTPLTPRLGLAFLGMNLLASTLATQGIPVGDQSVQSAPAAPAVYATPLLGSPELLTLPPSPQAVTRDPLLMQRQIRPQVLANDPIENRVLLAAATPIPPGHQQIDSAPPAAQKVATWDKATNVLTIPQPAVTRNPLLMPQNGPRQVFSDAQENRVILSQPQAIASTQLDAGQKLGPSQVASWQAPNLVIQLSAAQALPPGSGALTPSPQAPRIGGMLYGGRGVDPGAPFTPADPLPAGKQQTASAPIRTTAVTVDQFPNLLGSAIGLPQIASAYADAPLKTERAAQVFADHPRNLTLTLPVPGALPAGRQQSASAPIWPVPVGAAQGSTIPPDLLPPGSEPTPVATAIPYGAPHRWHARVGNKTYIGTLDQVLAKLQEAAEQDAEQAATQTTAPGPKAVKVRAMREAEKAQDLYQEVQGRELDMTRDLLSRMYENAYRDALAQIALRREQDDDDDEAILLLL